METGPGDREGERGCPTDANFPIILHAVYYFSVTNNLEFNIRMAVVIKCDIPPILRERRNEMHDFNKLENTSGKYYREYLSRIS